MEVSSLYGLCSRFCCFWNPRRRYTSVNDRQAQMLWGVWTSTRESPQEDALVTLCTFSFEEKSDGLELTVFLFPLVFDTESQVTQGSLGLDV